MLRALILTTLLCSACGGGDDDAPGSPDAATPDGAIVGGPDASTESQALGSSCTCEGPDCEQLGVPQPSLGRIIGCDDVSSWPGAARVCLRSYAGALSSPIYMANGYCGLMATSCTGAALVCTSAVFGDYDNMTTCPAGAALVADMKPVDVAGQMATVYTKVCAAGCTGPEDCRGAEPDSVHMDTAQYTCVDKDGVKFCYDPRNLTESYTATAF